MGGLAMKYRLYRFVQNSLDKCLNSPDILAHQKICVKSLKLFLNIPCYTSVFEALLLVPLLIGVLELSQILL